VTGLIEEETFLVVAFSNVDAPLSSSCLSINTIFTLMESGVDVIVGVGVREDVVVEVADGVKVDVLKGVILGVGEAIAVAVAVSVGVELNDGVNIDALVNMGVGEDITAIVAVIDGVKVGVIELVTVGGALVIVDVGIDVDVDVVVDVIVVVNVNGSDVCEGVGEIVAVAVITKDVSLGKGV
jgi:hypothetical protein